MATADIKLGCVIESLYHALNRRHVLQLRNQENVLVFLNIFLFFWLRWLSEGFRRREKYLIFIRNEKVCALLFPLERLLTIMHLETFTSTFPDGEIRLYIGLPIKNITVKCREFSY